MSLKYRNSDYNQHSHRTHLLALSYRSSWNKGTVGLVTLCEMNAPFRPEELVTSFNSLVHRNGDSYSYYLYHSPDRQQNHNPSASAFPPWETDVVWSSSSVFFISLLLHSKSKSGVVAHACNHRPLEAEAEGLL